MKAPSNVKDEWKKVGAHFRELGDKLRGHYQGQTEAKASKEKTGPSTDETAEAERPDSETTSGPAPSEPRQPTDPLKEVVDQLAVAVDRIADAVRDAASDPAVKEDASAVSTSLVDALAATFDEIGDEFRIVFEKARAGRSPGDTSSAADEGSEESAEDDADAAPEPDPDGTDNGSNGAG